jgi:hypothetical protein
MKVRTLVTDRRYFGVDPMTLRAAAARVLARVVGMPPGRAMVSAQALKQDFGVNTAMGRVVVDELVAGGLLLPHARDESDFHIHPKFMEFASARVVEPLPRARARLLVAKACELAARHNAGASRNPLAIDALVVFGAYMTRDSRLAELPLALVVRPRTGDRPRWGRVMGGSEGAERLRADFGALSSFFRVRIVTATAALPRPFAVVYDADA